MSFFKQSPFMPSSIENDPTYKQFHAYALPTCDYRHVDWSDCPLAKAAGLNLMKPFFSKRNAEARALKEQKKEYATGFCGPEAIKAFEQQSS